MELSVLGSMVEVSVLNRNEVEVFVHVISNEVVPLEEKILTKTGQLSVKEMSKTKFNEIYQAYVCSSSIRVARELFALLPQDKVYVHAIGEVLNTKTGHLKEVPVLSVVFPRDEFIRLFSTVSTALTAFRV